MRLRKPSSTLNRELRNADNLHRIAISNLRDHEHSLRRWWHQKYGKPPKPLDDYTTEELYIEYLEDFYDRNPDEIDKFLAKPSAAQAAINEEWDGTEKFRGEDEALAMLARIRKRQGKTVDLTKYQSDEEVSDEEFAKIFASIGKVQRPKLKGPPALGDDEFEDTFGSGT